MSELYYLTDRAQRAFEQNMRERERNRRLLNGEVSNDEALSLKNGSFGKKEEFISHLKEEGVTSVTVVPVRLSELVGDGSNFVGPFPVVTYATFAFSFKGQECSGIFVDEYKDFKEKKKDEKNEVAAYQRAEEYRSEFPHLEVRLRTQTGQHVDEGKLRSIEERARRLQERLDSLPPVPRGMTYKEFLGELILFPETGREPVVGETDFTEKQLYVAREVLFVKNAYPLSLFRSYLEKREKMLREGYPDIDDFVRR